MSRLPLWTALALVLAVNAVVLAGAARNRSGTPEAALTLTERELVLDRGPSREENSGMALHLVLNTRESPPAWLDEAKLVELGFDPATDPAPSEPTRSARSLLPRKAFVVLEYEGAAWERFRAKKEQELASLEEELREGKVKKEEGEQQRAQLEGALSADSRLFAIDAGLVPQQLRQRYPDRGRTIIAPALVRVHETWNNGKRSLGAHVSEILTDNLHVPKELHAALIALPEEGRLSQYSYYQPGTVPRPGYEARVEWGRRLEPWVVGVRAIE